MLDTPKLNIKVPTPGSRCAYCGSAELSSLPFYAVGCGLVYRSFADDVVCRHCGRMGPPVYTSNANAKPPAKDTQTAEKSGEQKPPKSE